MTFQIQPVGKVSNKENSTVIEIYPEYSKALLGLEGFSNIMLFCWFHKNDRTDKRKTLQVHPMKNRDKPLTGVFATRSPQRPNPIAVFMCTLNEIKENKIIIEKIDAFDNTPVIDIKPYIPHNDSIPNARISTWAKKGD
jgi:tRNA-Thr(GGU) m(6)t(6)A37 methyltransferase TsaA